MDRKNLSRYLADNTGLIHMVAQKGYPRLSAVAAGMEYDDLVQDLTVVFIKSYDGFDESFGHKFSTYFMRSAYNHVNKLMEHYEIERITLGTRSVEEMNSWQEESMDVSETIPSDYATPEQLFEAREMAGEMIESVSPLAQMIAQMTIDPPDFIEHEFCAAQVHAERSRQIGQERRSSKSINMSFVCGVLEKTTGLSKAMLKSAREEITLAVSRS